MRKLKQPYTLIYAGIPQFSVNIYDARLNLTFMVFMSNPVDKYIEPNVPLAELEACIGLHRSVEYKFPGSRL